jgi:hypothetical protein
MLAIAAGCWLTAGCGQKQHQDPLMRSSETVYKSACVRTTYMDIRRLLQQNAHAMDGRHYTLMARVDAVIPLSPVGGDDARHTEFNMTYFDNQTRPLDPPYLHIYLTMASAPEFKAGDVVRVWGRCVHHDPVWTEENEVALDVQVRYLSVLKRSALPPLY